MCAAGIQSRHNHKTQRSRSLSLMSGLMSSVRLLGASVGRVFDKVLATAVAVNLRAA